MKTAKAKYEKRGRKSWKLEKESTKKDERKFEKIKIFFESCGIL